MDQNISRRRFLLTTGTTIAGATLSTSSNASTPLPTQEAIAFASATPSSPIELHSVIQEIFDLAGHDHKILSDVSHESRTPLLNITMAIQAAQILVEKISAEPSLSADIDKLKQYLQIAHVEARREMHLLNQLLNISRVEYYENWLNGWESVNPQELFAQITFLTRNKSCGPTCDVHIPDNLPAFRCHPQSLPLILEELLMNARKFTLPEETIAVAVHTPQPALDLPEGNAILKLTVSNSGIEIPPEHLPHIFKKYYRVPLPDEYRAALAVRDKPDLEQPFYLSHRVSCGLGLYLIDQLCQKLGGRVQATSQQGWTTLTVFFPIQTV